MTGGVGSTDSKRDALKLAGDLARRPRAALSQTYALVAVILVAIILGAGGYYAGSLTATTVTTTNTVTTSLTVTGTPIATASMAQFIAYGGGTTQAAERLVVDAGTAQGFYSSNGLAPQWLQSSPSSNYLNYPSLTAVGAVVGIGPTSDALLAAANGLPISILATFSGAPPNTAFFALSNSSIKTPQDLAGKTVGVVATNTASAIWLAGTAYAKRTGINFTMIPEGNATNAVAALTSGKTDAMLGGVSPLMPSGQIVTIVSPNSMWSTPFAGASIWATNSMIKENPTLVKAFVNATLAAVNYLNQNSSYAANLYIKDFQGTPAFLLPAATTVANLDFTPNGTGGGTSMVTGVDNAWQFYMLQCTGTCNANLNVTSAANTSFLPAS